MISTPEFSSNPNETYLNLLWTIRNTWVKTVSEWTLSNFGQYRHEYIMFSHMLCWVQYCGKMSMTDMSRVKIPIPSFHSDTFQFFAQENVLASCWHLQYIITIAEDVDKPDIDYTDRLHFITSKMTVQTVSFKDMKTKNHLKFDNKSHLCAVWTL